MKELNSYSFDNENVEFSIYFPSELQELEDSIFRFESTYYIEKKLSQKSDEEYDYEKIPVFSLIGHTGDFDSSHFYAADAISEETTGNYALAEGVYEQLKDSEFSNHIFGLTGQLINRWLSLEVVYAMKELEYSDELLQANLFGRFLNKFKQMWKQLFYNDITLVSFNEKLYVSDNKEAQLLIEEAYKNVGFFPTLHKQEYIEKGKYDSFNITLRELFELDINNNLLSENIKDSTSNHYSGFIYGPMHTKN